MPVASPSTRIPCEQCTFKRHPDEKYVWCCCDYKPAR